MTKESEEFHLNHPTVPIIQCRETADSWVFFCPFCKRLHHHGKVEGPRVAHCMASDSPFDKSGYYLVLKKGVD